MLNVKFKSSQNFVMQLTGSSTLMNCADTLVIVLYSVCVCVCVHVWLWKTLCVWLSIWNVRSDCHDMRPSLSSLHWSVYGAALPVVSPLISIWWCFLCLRFLTLYDLDILTAGPQNGKASYICSGEAYCLQLKQKSACHGQKPCNTSPGLLGGGPHNFLISYLCSSIIYLYVYSQSLW